tara:strand:- start:126 stop:437 length:312 start_codon:yes stop_codon:yes gene_type:complete
MITMEELNKKYEQTLRYLERASCYEDHADKPWIVESTLARWMYIGSKQVIKGLEQDANDLGVRGRNFLKRICKDELDRRLKYFRSQLTEDFPDDELIREEITR